MKAKPYDSNLLLKPFSDPLEVYELEYNGKDRTHQALIISVDKAVQYSSFKSDCRGSNVVHIIFDTISIYLSIYR